MGEQRPAGQGERRRREAAQCASRCYAASIVLRAAVPVEGVIGAGDFRLSPEEVAEIEEFRHKAEPRAPAGV